MKKLFLLSFVILLSSSMFAADPPKKDISSILSLNSSLSLGLTIPGEQAIKGCVGDFNNDGVDDFIVTGLYLDGATTKGFLRVYLGKKTGVPEIAYENKEFPIAGNGAIDCTKLADGSFLVVLQGGSVGNWVNPFKGMFYNLKVTGSTCSFTTLSDLNLGAGRGSILFLDVNNDGFADIFQGGWAASGTWTARTQIYINDGTNEWFDLENYGAGNDPIRPANNTLVVKGDMNNDGKIDLLQPVQGIGLFAYFNKGDKTFEEVLVTPFPKIERTDGMNIRNEEDGTQAELIDFNGDGLLDIVMAGTNDGTGGDWAFILKFFKNNGNKTFTEITQTDKAGNPVTFVGGQRGDFAIADFDGDGKKDIIVGAESQNAAKAWLCRTFFLSGNGQGGFDQSEITFDQTSNPNGIVAMSRRAQFGRYLVGDFNGDDKPDLITAGSNYYAKDGGLRIYYNTSITTAIENPETASDISVYSEGKTIRINGADNAIATVYNLAGVQVYQSSITSDNESFTLNAAPGVYLVKVAGHTQKIMIK